MRRDPTSEKTYSMAVQLIEKSLNRKIRKIQLLNMTKREIETILGIRKIFLDAFKGFYFPKTDKIYIVDGNEEDLQTLVHETLHSNSIFHHENSPIWLYEGMTKALTEFVMLKTHNSIQSDLYLKEEKEFWARLIKTNQDIIVEAYFSENLMLALNLLKKIFNIEENIVDLNFNDVKNLSNNRFFIGNGQ
ncbi:MAG: hypothetical protein ACTSRW_01630 [Candidatus Helarchaeota archaeon]